MPVLSDLDFGTHLAKRKANSEGWTRGNVHKSSRRNEHGRVAATG